MAHPNPLKKELLKINKEKATESKQHKSQKQSNTSRSLQRRKPDQSSPSLCYHLNIQSFGFHTHSYNKEGPLAS
jgi:hypothetical protein